MRKKESLTRRGFLAGAAGAAFAIPAIVPARVLGADAPSEKLHMGAIGLGGYHIAGTSPRLLLWIGGFFGLAVATELVLHRLADRKVMKRYPRAGDIGHRQVAAPSDE